MAMSASIRIAVSDPLPVFRRGLMAVLGDAGFEPRTPEELLAWIRDGQRPVVLLTLLLADDWSLLARLRETRADTLVIAVVADTSIRGHVQAILGGAVAVVARNALPETVRGVFEAAVSGKSLLPVEVVRALTAPRPFPEEDETTPSPQEIGWLRELAMGTTVARLADRAGYSERAMFRLLRELYLRVGARNRTEALMHAQERGWL
jgi:DNA-binding NarL/FixJ family response regulator